MSATSLGLDRDKNAELITQLNNLLAHFQVYYQNLRGFHWNIQGRNFFELHAKFEELYTDAQLKVDEIAERVLTLGGRPLHSFEQYLAVSGIRPAVDVSDGAEAVRSIAHSLQVFLGIERSILSLASEAGDEGTVALMSDNIAQQEKLHWMLRAWLND